MSWMSQNVGFRKVTGGSFGESSHSKWKRGNAQLMSLVLMRSSLKLRSRRCALGWQGEQSGKLAGDWLCRNSRSTVAMWLGCLGGSEGHGRSQWLHCQVEKAKFCVKNLTSAICWPEILRVRSFSESQSVSVVTQWDRAGWPQKLFHVPTSGCYPRRMPKFSNMTEAT